MRSIRNKLTTEAEKSAVNDFGVNLRNLLLQPPTRGKVVMGIDPGKNRFNKSQYRPWVCISYFRFQEWLQTVGDFRKWIGSFRGQNISQLQPESRPKPEGQGAVQVSNYDTSGRSDRTWQWNCESRIWTSDRDNDQGKMVRKQKDQLHSCERTRRVSFQV